MTTCQVESAPGVRQGPQNSEGVKLASHHFIGIPVTHMHNSRLHGSSLHFRIRATGTNAHQYLELAVASICHTNIAGAQVSATARDPHPRPTVTARRLKWIAPLHTKVVACHAKVLGSFATLMLPFWGPSRGQCLKQWSRRLHGDIQSWVGP